MPSTKQDKTLSVRMDKTGTYTYIGDSEPGTPTSASAWRIARLTVATGDILYPDHGDFTQIWDNRASLSYS